MSATVAGQEGSRCSALYFLNVQCLNAEVNSYKGPACSSSPPTGPGPQVPGPKQQRSLPQEAHVPDGLILQLWPEQGVQLRQDGDEPAARHSTGTVRPDTEGTPRAHLTRAHDQPSRHRVLCSRVTGPTEPSTLQLARGLGLGLVGWFRFGLISCFVGF